MDWMEIIRMNRIIDLRNGLEQKLLDDDKDYLLAVAVKLGRYEMVQTLLAYGAAPNKWHGFDGHTPLHEAVGSCGHFATEERLRLVKLLLDAGADVDARTTGPRSLGWTPLHCLASRPGGQPEIARLLYDYGADVEAPDQYGHAPIHFARDTQNHELAAQIEKLARGNIPRRGKDAWVRLDASPRKHWWRIWTWGAAS